ncbi:MAG TPA: hypothetical protein VHJ39_19335 [Solirubrobacteraceae bacterium]|nr:hypothetical protein [Solirubrobacteraceae bacterium]
MFGAGQPFAADDRVLEPDADVAAGRKTGVDHRPAGAGVAVPEAGPSQDGDAIVDCAGQRNGRTVELVGPHQPAAAHPHPVPGTA